MQPDAHETLFRTPQQALTKQAPGPRMHADDLPEGHVEIDVSARGAWFGIGRVPRIPRRCR
jgi:hypothetical protein